MSVIAVEIKDKEIKFVADSQITYANQAYLDQKKVIKIGNIIIGVAGKSRILQQIKKYLLNTAEKIELNTEVEVITLLQDIEKQSDVSSPMFPEDTEILITDSKNVWLIQPETLTVIRVNKFEAIGSGANYAIGAYKASGDIKKSIEIACESNINCSLPLIEETTKIQ